MDGSQNSPRAGLGLSIATVLAIVATLVVNTLSNRYPPGGKNIAEISNTILAGVLITPANYAFIIWGVIYLGLIAYAVYQFHPERRHDPNIQQTNRLLILACLAQVIWIFLFTLQQFGWSILAMLGILIPLAGIYLTLEIGHGRVSRQRRWMAHIPFSIYLGWISVATIVNVASALYAAGWGGWGITPEAWTMIMIVVAAIVAAVVIWQRGDVAFTFVFVWAFGAIAQRHSDTTAIWATAAGMALLLVLGLLGLKGLNRRSV